MEEGVLSFGGLAKNKRWTVVEVRMRFFSGGLGFKQEVASGPLKRFASWRAEDGSGKGHPRLINYPDPVCLQCGTPRDPGTQSRPLGIIGDPGAIPATTSHCNHPHHLSRDNNTVTDPLGSG